VGTRRSRAPVHNACLPDSCHCVAFQCTAVLHFIGCCCSLCQTKNSEVTRRHPGQFLWSGFLPLLSTKPPRFTRGIKALLGSKCDPGCLVGWKSFLAIVPSMLSSTLLSMPDPCTPQSRDTLPPSTPPARDTHPLQHTTNQTSATTMLAPIDMQESSLSHNEFTLCLRSLLQPSSALSQLECVFARVCER